MSTTTFFYIDALIWMYTMRTLLCYILINVSVIVVTLYTAKLKLTNSMGKYYIKLVWLYIPCNSLIRCAILWGTSMCFNFLSVQKYKKASTVLPSIAWRAKANLSVDLLQWNIRKPVGHICLYTQCNVLKVGHVNKS